MAAVAAVDVVVHVEEKGLAHGRGLLADREVRRAPVVVLDALVRAAQLDLVQHGLELADEDHVAIDADGVVLRQSRRPQARRPGCGRSG